MAVEKLIRTEKNAFIIKATAGALIRYRQQFGREYLDDLKSLKDINLEDENEQLRMLTIGFNLLWAMAKTADDSIYPPQEFLAIVCDNDILKLKTYIEQAEKLFNESMQGMKDYGDNTSDEPLNVETLIAISSLSGLNTTDIDNLSVATLLNSINEYWKMKNGGADSDSKSDNARIATQADIDAFFGR